MNILIEGGRLNLIQRGEGTRNIALSYAQKFLEKGHKVTVLTRKKNKDNSVEKNIEICNGIKFYRWSNLLHLSILFRKIIKKEKIDFIYVFAKGARPKSYMSFINKFSQKPIIFNLLGDPFTKKYKDVKKTLSSFSYAKKVLVSSKTIHQKLLSLGLRNSEYFPYGINTHRFAPREDKKKSNYKNILCMRNPKKDMLKAIESLSKEQKILLILNKERAQNISGISQSFNINIKEIGHLKDPSKLFQEVDLYIDLQNKEELIKCASPPLMILEAMSCGCKVLSTKKSEIEEIIKDNKNGFLTDENNEKSIYEKTKIALKSKDIGEEARKTILEKYNLDKLIDQHLGILSKILIR